MYILKSYFRTGFLISSYLIETQKWSPQASVVEFAKARPPGIYKQKYISELFARYGNISDAPEVPKCPDWCVEEDLECVKYLYHATSHNNSDHNFGRPPKTRPWTKNPVFMEGVSGVTPVTTQPLLTQIQKRFQQLCGWKKQGFPGSQPVSMDPDNISFITLNSYKVSWKADGNRYMMLIDGPNSIFFADRNHCIFKVK
jgi:mRNA-capping enzyme